MEHKKIFDKNIYSHEMDYQGYYPPASMHRLCNSSYFGCMRDNGLPYPAIRAKINATHMVGMADLHILKPIQVLNDVQSVELYSLSSEIIESLRPIAAKRDINLRLTGESAEIKGVRQILSEMIYNLCDNAIKYNKDGGRVRVFVGKTGDKAEISVKDTGIGIPNEDKDRIFERFYRVDKSHSKTVGGTGLGLSIVKHIAMCHNAEITVKSELNVGTTITVDFDAAEPVNI